MDRNSTYFFNIKELGRYFHISYDKAINLVNDPSFPKGILGDRKVFPRDKIAAWAEERINYSTFQVKATSKATRVKTHNKV